MTLKVVLEIFDRETAAKKHKKYELQWSVQQATSEDLRAAAAYLNVISKKFLEEDLRRLNLESDHP